MVVGSSLVADPGEPPPGTSLRIPHPVLWEGSQQSHGSPSPLQAPGATAPGKLQSTFAFCLCHAGRRNFLNQPKLPGAYWQDSNTRRRLSSAGRAGAPRRTSLPRRWPATTPAPEQNYSTAKMGIQPLPQPATTCHTLRRRARALPRAHGTTPATRQTRHAEYRRTRAEKPADDLHQARDTPLGKRRAKLRHEAPQGQPCRHEPLQEPLPRGETKPALRRQHRQSPTKQRAPHYDPAQLPDTHEHERPIKSKPASTATGTGVPQQERQQISPHQPGTTPGCVTQSRSAPCHDSPRPLHQLPQHSRHHS
mmetsp:Transcript_6949/g.14913  ORF Transcript_6949/g.14913 Transcript_6949/m.14913 type:complete len:308 (+) Transcript_6949:356-1279(+)